MSFCFAAAKSLFEGDAWSIGRLQLLAVGILQKIDAAVMKLYAVWCHFEADVTGVAGAIATDDIETVHTSARIKF